jgi:hypothetical protein
MVDFGMRIQSGDYMTSDEKAITGLRRGTEFN